MVYKVVGAAWEGALGAQAVHVAGLMGRCWKGSSTPPSSWRCQPPWMDQLWGGCVLPAL